MNLKDIKGVIGEKLPVKPTMMAQLSGRKGKLAGVMAAAIALIAAIAELM